MAIHRTYWRQVNLPLVYLASTRKEVKPGSASGMIAPSIENCPKKLAQLVASLTRKGRHAPVLDIDFPATLTQISGAARILIESPMPDPGQIANLRDCLVDCGFVAPLERSLGVQMIKLDDDRLATLFAFNVGIRLLPSSTAGHYHLYIDHETTWDKFQRLLSAMYAAGFLGFDYYQMCTQSKMSFVRKPGVTKNQTTGVAPSAS